jgi:F0F1-type ATP synthase membrane subunit b/b'
MNKVNNEMTELSVQEMETVVGGSLSDHVQKALNGNFFDRLSKQSDPWDDGKKQ